MADLPDLQTILANLRALQGNGGGGEAVSGASATSETPAASHDPRLASRPPPPPPQRPIIDPATITVWPEALRCINKISAQNAEFSASIRRMIKNQRVNEMNWYKERQNLKQIQSQRHLAVAKATAIMKALNGDSYKAPYDPETPEEKKEKELKEFDAKIWRAQCKMDEAMTMELKGLGVPFFGTEKKLIVKDEEDVSKMPVANVKWSPYITEAQLEVLQKKMVEYLEDLVVN